MFPRLRQKLGPALVERLDLLVEFSTLGEYALADDLLPVAMHAAPCPGRGTDTVRDERAARGAAATRGRPRDDCPVHDAPLSRRCND